MRFPRVSPLTFRRITLVVLVAVAAIVVTGGAVRLTGSGLGCANWPSCTDNHFVSVTGFHRQIEQANRLFTGVVSVAIILAVLGSLARVPRRHDLVWWSLGLVGGLIGQIVLGGITVIFHLWPPLVMGHFILSAILTWNAVVLLDRASHDGTAPALTTARRTQTLGRAVVGLAGLALVTGTVVTGTGPHGGDEHVARLPFAIEDVARIHSLTVWLFLGASLLALGSLYRSGASPMARRRSAVLVAVIVAQGAIGYTQYFTGVPPGLVMVHIAGSVAVWVAALRFYLGLFAHPAAQAEQDVVDQRVPAAGWPDTAALLT